jgi:hypothetical protein
LSPDLNVDKFAIASYCQAYGVTRLALFGSAVKGTLRADSDVDVLVEFEAGRTPGFLGMAKMARELSALLGGRTVDLRTPKELSRFFRAEVLATCEEQYARG